MEHDANCVFCRIVARELEASIIYEDDLTLAFVDLRQFNPGHTLVIPREHFSDIRQLDPVTGAALMTTRARITRAVDAAFPNEGISLWHSIGPAAFQEAPHLHVHIHPRRTDDQFLRVYPSDPATPNKSTLDAYAVRIRECLSHVA